MTDEQRRDRVYIGTYTDPSLMEQGQPESIFIGSFDAETGALEIVDVVTGVPNPSYLTLSANGQFLYAVNELLAYKGQAGGAISAFAIDAQSGGLTWLNTQPTLGGTPCYISLISDGQFALVANYAGGNVATLRISPDGRLGDPAVQQHYGHSINPERQQSPHAHCVLPDPTNQYILVADLGLDKILIYRLDGDAGKLIAHSTPEFRVKPGGGPRHMAFHPNGRYVYVTHEFTSSVGVYGFDALTGELCDIQSAQTIPDNFTDSNYCAEVRVAASGKFAYVSNRGHDSIPVFAVDEADGRLSTIGYVPTEGQMPRHFTIHASGEWLLVANHDSHRVVVFRVDVQTGMLSPTGHSVTVPNPVCVKFGG